MGESAERRRELDRIYPQWQPLTLAQHLDRVPEPGSRLDPAQIVATCKQSLARFKVPKHVLFLEPGELPTTPTGKVQKFKLVELAAARIGAGA